MTKKGQRIKIHSNWKLLYVILILIVVFIILIYLIAKNNQKSSAPVNSECKTNSDCVPSSCCHSDKCVQTGKEQSCKGMFCSMDCEGPLDCGAGHCGCINNKCAVIPGSK
jgi:hypothetical protein